jgi:AraC family transcriptional regulator
MGSVSDLPYIPFREAHGMNRLDVLTREWNGVTVHYHEKYQGPGRVWGDMYSESSSLAVQLDARGGYSDPRFKLDQPTARSRYDTGFAVWVPARHTVWGFSETAYFVREVRFTFDAAHLPDLLEDDFDHALARDPLLLLYDSRVTQCANLLSGACIEPVDGDRLYGESLTTALFAAFFSARRKKHAPGVGSGLASWQLRRSKEYMRAHLAEDISLAELAKITKLSQSQFARAFRDSTGLPPYRYILRSRIERAEGMLATTSRSISEIAANVGFADQSHFTKAFRRFVGATPKRWRQDRQG